MSDNSRIAWCDATWNPIVGCTPVSAACEHCYAERGFKRLAGAYGYPREFSRVTFREDSLDQPLRWRKPRRIFVCSMGDMFHEEARDVDRLRIFEVMSEASQHTFLVLTKRALEMESWCQAYGCPPNVWLGVTAENQETANERIPLLLKTNPVVRFVSCEPLLGPVDFRKVPGFNLAGAPGRALLDNFWVIAGGESGPGARPTHPEWVRSLRDQCATAGVPFLFKQWGEWSEEQARFIGGSWPWEKRGPQMFRVGKRAAGRLLDGREHLEFPRVEP